MIRRMMDPNPENRPTAEEILTYYVPEQKEIEAKWIRIEHKLLKEQKSNLESLLLLQTDRRKSL